MGLTGCKIHSGGKCYPNWAAHSVDNLHSVENTATSRGTTALMKPRPTSLVARQDLPSFNYRRYHEHHHTEYSQGRDNKPDCYLDREHIFGKLDKQYGGKHVSQSDDGAITKHCFNYTYQCHDTFFLDVSFYRNTDVFRPTAINIPNIFDALYNHYILNILANVDGFHVNYHHTIYAFDISFFNNPRADPNNVKPLNDFNSIAFNIFIGAHICVTVNNPATPRDLAIVNYVRGVDRRLDDAKHHAGRYVDAISAADDILPSLEACAAACLLSASCAAFS
ncbi:hypothetical protein B0T26DRAFT_752386 [Lasiosphaeria miniovina]|uniref:Uncharacterized protein n=1 Tax=Lasiosphaeria miniovina TaxID=1954250 RepID=A0AA40AMB6_9PEZI|nr:uncharacterized protein B0T26DRAFT_752386 [Lasiosphaeria miniovina]KAK0718469.1 hypothetical protein B0T26DRAFT_752386 [Lasiosphaeria miniovina]